MLTSFQACHRNIMKSRLNQLASRRCRSVWAKIGRTPVAECDSASKLGNWTPPPKPIDRPEVEDARPPQGSLAVFDKEAVEGNKRYEEILELEQQESEVDVDPMGPLRLAEPPWPHIPTPNSAQIEFQNEYNDELGIHFWGDLQRKRETEEENTIIMVDHRWEPRPFLNEQVDYKASYAFHESYRMVGRERGEREFKGSGIYYEQSTRNVSIRTNNRIKVGDVAYFEAVCQASSLNFGIGVVEATSFEPTKWFGYYKNSAGYFEDGRIGTIDEHHFGRVIKVGDVIGTVLVGDPTKDHFDLLFLKNGKPSGKLLQLPKSRAGYYFGVTMASYHTGQSTCKINTEPTYLEESLNAFGRLCDESDVDFADEPLYDFQPIQRLCNNRRNPFHVCSSKCREIPEYYLVDEHDEYGKPALVTSVLSSRPSWLSQSGEPKSVGRNGVWKFISRHDGKGRKFLNYKHIDTDAIPRAKYSRYKAARWNLGNMKFG